MDAVAPIGIVSPMVGLKLLRKSVRDNCVMSPKDGAAIIDGGGDACPNDEDVEASEELLD
jgi:hypothetical protein